jgi:hypothetical protein
MSNRTSRSRRDQPLLGRRKTAGNRRPVNQCRWLIAPSESIPEIALSQKFLGEKLMQTYRSPLQTSRGGGGGKVNTDVFDNFSGAIYADTDLGNSVLRGKMRYGRNEEVGINGEVEVATANEELTKEFKGQQKRGDSADIGQHKMGDFKFFCMVPNFSELLLQNLLMSSKFYSCNFAHLT